MEGDTPELQQGDRVRLKGGYGPVMTVDEVFEPIFKYRYRCVWQDAQGTVFRELFRAEQVEQHPPVILHT
jgi:uncharacterized protein YodC (DUF2158 family)